MSEVWKNVVGFENLYEVSSEGRIRSLLTGHIRPVRLLKGYPGVTLNGAPRNRRLFTVHSLVAAAFIGPRPSGFEVNHIDGIKTNARAENLEYCSSARNKQHARDLLGAYKGERNGAAVLTKELVIEIRAKYQPRVLGAHRLANMYGVSKPMIYNIVKRRAWGHV